MATLEIIKRIRLRTGFFKIYESVDRLDMLDLENKILKDNIRKIKQEAVMHKNTIDQYKNSNDLLTKKVEDME